MSEKPILDTLEEKITGIGGTFIYCHSVTEFQQQFVEMKNERSFKDICCTESPIMKLLPSEILVYDHFSEKCEVSITGCEYLVAQTGSIILSTSSTKSRKIFSFPTIHLIVAGRNQLIDELDESICSIPEKYPKNFPSQITVITGPSRTADIEKTLIMGAHGPRELIIFYINEELNY